MKEVNIKEIAGYAALTDRASTQLTFLEQVRNFQD
jgi:hypothetical protein